ncbi:unnamed protein product [Moneuplotes crassus]|uniref:Uncharacterized protein n=1 Tax=Euplotes crassus TaxID=5936 RepID=A0AAD1XG35_EUPCR|nr:unnamed protein product [Moneuplotes crassus]
MGNELYKPDRQTTLVPTNSENLLKWAKCYKTPQPVPNYKRRRFRSGEIVTISSDEEGHYEIKQPEVDREEEKEEKEEKKLPLISLEKQLVTQDEIKPTYKEAPLFFAERKRERKRMTRSYLLSQKDPSEDSRREEVKRIFEEAPDTIEILKRLQDIKGEPIPSVHEAYILWLTGLKKQDKYFIASVLDYKFPSYDELWIKSIARFTGNDLENLKKFLTNCAPKTLGNIFVNDKSQMTSLGRYIEPLQPTLKVVRRKISLHNLNISTTCLKSLLNASEKAQFLSLISCVLICDAGVKVEDKIASYQEIILKDTFKFCGTLNNTLFGAFLEAISETNLKDSLKRFTLKGMEADLDEAEGFLQKYGFEKTKIIQEEVIKPMPKPKIAKMSMNKRRKNLIH